MPHPALRLSAVALALACAHAGTAHAQTCPATLPAQGAAIGDPLPVFPADNWWNTDITSAPVDQNSTNFINFIGAGRGMHPDFGGVDSEDPTGTSIYGFPYAVVSGNQTRSPVTFDYWDESDGVDMDTGAGLPFYPIPANAISQVHWVEGGAAATTDLRNDNDRHLLMIDCTNRTLYELYNVWYSPTQQRWYAGSGAFFDMNRNDRRPEGWTSADAAGLAIFPGLVRYDEAANPNVPEIRHAFRLTVRASNGHVYPASHTAGGTSGALPMGARLRLKKLVNGVDPVTRTNDPVARKILRAMQTYGLIVADNGSDMYVSGTFDVRWDNGTLNPAFGAIKASDFDVVQLGWKPPAALPTLRIDDATIAEGHAGTRVLSFAVRLSSASTSTVSVSIATVAATGTGIATSGTDYIPATGTLSFAPGQTSRTFAVTINGDRLPEANETFQVALSNPANATVADATATGTINNDDVLRTGGPSRPQAPEPAQSVGNRPIRVQKAGEQRYPRYPKGASRGDYRSP